MRSVLHIASVGLFLAACTRQEPRLNPAVTLEAPKDVTAEVNEQPLEVLLRWKPLPPPMRYHVFRSEVASQIADLRALSEEDAFAEAGFSPVHDTSVEAGKTYYYRVRATRDGILGEGSETIAVVIPAPPPRAEISGRKLAATDYRTCFIADTGRLYCWGDGVPAPAAVGADEDWAEVAVGQGHACAIKTDLSLWCWGENGSGQLGDNTGDDQPQPTRVYGGDAWVTVSTFDNHTCAIREDLSLWCWGFNYAGPLGDGTTRSKAYPVRVGSGEGWTSIATGFVHTCGIKEGALYCWGANWSGELGTGNTEDALTPARVGTGTDWHKVAAGSSFTCAIKTNHTLWCWGNEHYRSGWGNDYAPVQVEGAGWASVTLGSNGLCAFKIDTTLWCWGNMLKGDGTWIEDKIPTQIGSVGAWTEVALGYHGCVSRSDGTVYCWGENPKGELGIGALGDVRSPAGPILTNADEISVGRYHACGRELMGSVLCWGWNSSGQLGLADRDARQTPELVNGVWLQINAGSSQTCAVRADKQLWCWGAASIGELKVNRITGYADWQTVSTGYSKPCGIRAGGSLWCWSTSNTAPTEYDGQWLAIDSGEHSCGIKSDGSLWCWGNNDKRQTGTGSTSYTVAAPGQVAPGAIWKSVSVGGTHTCGIRENDSLWCWGDGDSLQTGIEGDIFSSVPTTQPTEVSFGGTWLAVAAGVSATCGIKTSGTLWCWGYVSRLAPTGYWSYTALQVGTASDWTAVDVGEEHACARKSNGTQWCWGRNQFGQVGNGYAWRLSPTKAF